MGKETLHRLVIPGMLLAGILWPAACRDGTRITRPDDSGIDRTYVTGAAALGLNSDGYFVLTPQRSGWSRPELTESEAAVFADIHATRFAPTLPSWFERSHGAAIDFPSLHRCGRAFYGLSPYSEPGPQVTGGRLNGVASRWLFTYCTGDELPAISVAVATTATHLKVANGTFDPSSMRGDEIVSGGIPRGSSLPVSPERAAEILAKASGRRVSTVPRFILPGKPYYPQAGRWEFDVETPVLSRNPQGVTRTDRTFFVGCCLTEWKVEVYRARFRADGDAPLDYIITPSAERIEFTRRPDVPRAWESVQFPEGRP